MFKKLFLKKDKQKHILYGFLASLFVGILTNAILGILVFTLFVSLLTSVIIGTGKEIYDSFGNGRVEFLDFVATVIGGIFGTIALYFWIVLL